MEERRTSENSIELRQWQIECKQVLMKHRAPRIRPRHLYKLRRTVQSYRPMPQAAKMCEVAPRTTPQIEKIKGTCRRQVTKEQLVVSGSIASESLITIFAGHLIVCRDRKS